MVSAKTKASTLVEVAVVIAILAIGIIAVYGLVIAGWRFASKTENQIQAINLAREWIEIASNIRDTNWIKFSSNPSKCFDVLNYDSNCISGTAPTLSWEYIPYLNNGQWHLSTIGASGSGIAYDARGLSIQNTTAYDGIYCAEGQKTSCKLKWFTRTIAFSLWDTTTTNGIKNLIATSTVRWFDSVGKEHEMVLEKTLTNWKENFK